MVQAWVLNADGLADRDVYGPGHDSGQESYVQIGREVTLVEAHRSDVVVSTVSGAITCLCNMQG